MKNITFLVLSSAFFNGVASQGQLYSFKCSTEIYMCGGLSRDQVCNNPGADTNGIYVNASPEECNGMIQATTREDTYSYKCPNNRAISHFVVYGCNGGTGTKYESGKSEQCSCPSGNCGKVGGCGGAVGGDPHFRTHDGTLYSFHGECDLVMARSPVFGNGLGLDVHARTQIIGGTWSLVSNAVVRIGDDVFEVANNGVHYFNGIPDIELPSLMSGHFQISKREEMLESNGDEEEVDASSFLRTWYTIDLENGEEIRITNFRTMISINVDANLSDTVGMLGSTGTPGLVGRDGSSIAGSSDEMGVQWQVTNTEPMLFHEIRAPQFPETCVLPLVNTLRRLRQSDEMYEQAKEACAGLQGAIQNFCIEDVILTGDAAVSKAYGSVF